MIRRAMLAALLCAALLVTAARADEATYYAGFFDDCYHAAAGCALATSVSPVTRAEAEAQGKRPCPVCVDDPTKYGGVEAIERGGTMVIRVPDAWMAERPASETEDNFERYWAGEFTGREGALLLAEQLHGAEYRALLADMDTGIARAVARVPDIELDEGALLMNRRHIGAAWYLTYRPAALNEDGGKLAVPLFFTVNTLVVRDGAVDVNAGGLWRDEGFTVKPSKSRNRTAFEYESDGLSLRIFSEMGTHICVIHSPVSEAESLAGAALQIDGAGNGIRLDGYPGDGDAVFCCVLTDGEYAALTNGATAALELAIDSEAAIEAGFEAAFD